MPSATSNADSLLPFNNSALDYRCSGRSCFHHRRRRPPTTPSEKAGGGRNFGLLFEGVRCGSAHDRTPIFSDSLTTCGWKHFQGFIETVQVCDVTTFSRLYDSVRYLCRNFS
jgi:hypothetical protein